MPYLPLRKIEDRSVRGLATEWLEALASSLADETTDRAQLCRQTLTELFYPDFAANWETE